MEEMILATPKFKCPKHGIIDNNTIEVNLPNQNHVATYCLVCLAEWYRNNLPEVKAIKEEKS